MHFSKTYAKLLLDLPPELRENAIQYRQLKKLLNQVVLELSSLGLSPNVLHELLEEENVVTTDKGKGKGKEVVVVDPERCLESSEFPEVSHHPKVVYEFNNKSGKIEPRLRIWVATPLPTPSDSQPESEDNSEFGSSETELGDDGGGRNFDEGTGTNTPPFRGDEISLLWALQRRAVAQDWEETSRIEEIIDDDDNESHGVATPTVSSDSNGKPREVVVPLVKDSAFFQLLSGALHHLSDHLSTMYHDFTDTLTSLSKGIGDSARPVSSTSSSFRPYSALAHPGLISSSARTNKSDLYSWREIFQLYIEAEVFESVNESHPGEQPIEESEKRLKLFADRVAQRGLGDQRKLKSKQSVAMLETFLELNMFIINIKKFQLANSEATRKILKKHAKRTALPLPGDDYYTREMALIPQSNSSLASLPRVLVQAIGEILLPIVPHLDDYSCIICTNIAFKPIRLKCGHLFCVRCLVKMQKRGQGDCPMCRAPTVLTADRSNVDWALLNFMQDWFPVEAHAKLKQSEKEATEEQLIEMGIDPDQKCIVM